MEEVRLAGDSIEIVLLPTAGGRIHRLRAYGEDLLRTPEDPHLHLAEPFAWGAYPMAPWANRISARRVRYADREVAVQANFPDGTAIHGQVCAMPWAIAGDGSLQIHAGGDGWPWSYEVNERIEIVDRTVEVSLSLTNRSPDPMPGGLGLHPWFRSPVMVAIRGDRVYEKNAAAEAQPRAVRGAFDRRRLGELPAGMDATWVGIGDPAAELVWPKSRIHLTMRVRASRACVVAARPAGSDALALEPQTHAPEGLRRLINGEPDSLEIIAPGATLQLGVTLEIDRE
jgi:aldose 1-epimerase